MNRRNPKPLRGFGWAGWCLLAVALTLAGLMLAGVDVRHRIFSALTDTLGIKSVYVVAARVLPSLGFFDYPFLPIGPSWSWSPPDMRFSLTTMCLVLIALHVHPRPTGVARITGLVLLGLLPCLTFDSIIWFEPLFPPTAPGGIRPTIPAMAVFAVATAVIGAPVLAWVTRSIRIGLIALAYLLLGAWLNVEVMRATAAPRLLPLVFAVQGNETWFVTISWLWNPIAFSGLLAWAIAARRRIFPGHCCQACGYDLRATPQCPCPECGALPPTPDLPVAPRDAISTS